MLFCSNNSNTQSTSELPDIKSVQAGGQTYSDTAPYKVNECSLEKLSNDLNQISTKEQVKSDYFCSFKNNVSFGQIYLPDLKS